MRPEHGRVPGRAAPLRTARAPDARRRRAAGLWALFYAQTLLAESTDAFALAEDDRYRLGAERGADGDGLSLRYR